jgi:hypothetical protein
LFVADISPGGGLGSGNANTGKIYQIMSLVPEPSSLALFVLGTAWLVRPLRRRMRGEGAR